jgi:hypothetical protein
MRNYKLLLFHKDKYQFKSATKFLITRYTVWFILGMLIGSGLLYSFKDEPEPIIEYVEIMIPDTLSRDIKLNQDEILQELIKNKCILPNVALAQFIKESAHFTSKISIENKNIAGIRNSTSQFVKRDKNGIPIKNRGHNVYESYSDCIKDYIRIQNMYLKNIDRRYAEDTNYIYDLHKIKYYGQK